MWLCHSGTEKRKTLLSWNASSWVPCASHSGSSLLLQEGTPSRGGTCLGRPLVDKARVALLKKGRLGGELAGQGFRERLCQLAQSLGFYGDGVSLGLSLASRSEDRGLPGGVRSLSQDGLHPEGFRGLVGHTDWCPFTPFDLS